MTEVEQTNVKNWLNNLLKSDKDKAIIKQAESDFLATTDHNYWRHGIEAPYTVFQYHRSKKLTNQINLNKNEGMFYKPMAVFQELCHKESVAEMNNTKAVYDTEENKEYAELLHPEIDQVQAFSGYFSLPKIALNLPSSKNDAEINERFLNTIAKIAYQNHISLDESIFTFGGLFYDDQCSFKDLGLPEDVDPLKISVHLPANLPPYLDRDILLSPYLQQNHNFHLVNPSRGTVTLLNSFVTNMPSHLNGLSSTRLSSRHLFLFGGFELRIKSVDYNDQIDRWIIEKEFYINDNGFILDSKTLTFTKINLIKDPDSENVVDTDFNIGRIGHSITSNVYEKSIIDDSNSSIRVPTPTYVDSTHFSPYIPGEGQRSPSSSSSPLMKTKSATNPTTHTSNTNTSSSLHGSLNHPAGKTVINTKGHLNSEPTTPATSSASNGYFKSGIHRSNTSSSNDTTHTRLHSSKSLSSRESKRGAINKVMDRMNLHHSSSPVSNRQPSPLAAQQHQAPQTPAQQQPAQPTPLSPQTQHAPQSQHVPQPQSLPQQLHLPNQSLLSSDNSPHMNLLSTYSDQVKQNRSNSSSLHSRPVSPIPSTPMVAPKPIPFKMDDKLNTEVTFDDDQDEKLEHTCGDSNAVCDACLKAGKSLRRPNDLYGDVVLKPGELLANVFIFGGFVEYKNNGVKSFKATNDFLRIDLICDGDFFAKNIKPNANIYKIRLDQAHDLTPSPRGYFASTLIDYDTESDLNCDWNRLKRSFSPSSVFEEETNCSTSIQSSNSKHASKLVRIKTPEEFFDRKAILIHGGCNDEKQTFPDMYVFKFTTGEWEEMSTYSYQYYENQENPFEDDASDDLTKENQIKDPDLIDAELRACHHTALYYNKLGREFVFFLGGFDNNYLRHFEPEPYKSTKFDVSRLSRYRYATTNYDINRMLVYNIKTQTWGFYKFFYDLRKNTSNSTLKKLKNHPEFINSNLHFHGSGISMNGKIINISQGLVSIVSEKQEDYTKLNQEFSGTSLLFGGNIQITFPSL